VEGVSKKVDFGIGKNFGSLFSDGKWRFGGWCNGK
jgi:hypothetical protein